MFITEPVELPPDRPIWGTDARIAELEAENAALKVRIAETEDSLAAEQAEHTREVLLHAVTKHKLDEASKATGEMKLLYEAAGARADAAEKTLETIAAWPFDVTGDCVADARKLAAAARQDGPGSEQP